MHMYTVSQKQYTIFVSVTSPKVNRFSKFFHCSTRQDICNIVIFKYPSTP